MRLLTATLLASAFIASPALACSWNKTAGSEKSTYSATLDTNKTEQSHEAMSTFDPADQPVFEEEAAAASDTETEELSQ